jgi:uncharacterized repeat protein (TIGR01451 family)
VRWLNQSRVLKIGSAWLITIFLLTTWFAQPAAGLTPPQQGGRPTLPAPQPSGPGGGGSEEGGGGGAAGENCAGVRGTVINWGYQNEPGVALRLSGGGWETTQVSSGDGQYQFGGLGEGVGFLSVELSPTQAETLRPMADAVAIHLRCSLDVIANMGLYSGSKRPDPPATLTMGASQGTVLPGQKVTFYLKLKNGMPNAISHVFVTDYLPEGLTVSDVTTSLGNVEVLDGRMVTVNIGEMAQGDQLTMQIAVQANPDLAYGTKLRNTASLLYAESAVDQAWTTLVVGSPAVTTPAPAAASPAQSATPTPAAGASPATAVAVAPTPSPSTPVAEGTAQADDLLPVTGDAPAAVPAVAIGLAALLLGIRHLRKRVLGS